MPWDLTMYKQMESVRTPSQVFPISGQMLPLPLSAQEVGLKETAFNESMFRQAGLKFGKNTDDKLWKEG